LTFHLPQARSLKDKRSIVRGLVERLRARFNVSAAEVDLQASHQRAVVGVAVVSSSASVCHAVFEKVTRFAELHPEALLTHRETEVVVVGEDMFGNDGLHGDESE